ALEPADEHERIRCGHVERRAVHLLVLEDERVAEAFGDRMRPVDDPEPLALARLAPLEVTAGPHEAPDHLRVMAGVEDDQPHAVEDAPLDPIDDRVVDLAVCDMAPPRQDVSL